MPAMCQLLGMNCNVPTDICFSFAGFRSRGGGTDEHSDGWGIAFFEGLGCRVFLDTKPASASPIAEMVHQYPIRSCNVIAHIRKATQGEVALHNTHPFCRELWGRYWIFAHNGDLKSLELPPPVFYQPVGNTDSERAFCHLLDALRVHFGDSAPAVDALLPLIAKRTAALSTHGVFNYMLSNGEALFANCGSQLSYVTRRAPFGAAHLVDQDVTVDFSQVTTPNDVVTVIATLPLTDNEQWTTIEPGELVMFRDGERCTALDTASG